MADSPNPNRVVARVLRALSAVLAAGTLLLVAAAVVWADRPHVRYATMPCVYRMIHGSDAPAEAVFFGSSRMQFAVDPFAFAEALGRDPGSTAVLNLARQQGRRSGQVYRQLVEIERERGIEGPIVFEYAGGASFVDPFEPASVTYEALLANWNADPGVPVHERAQTLARQALRKFDVAVESALVGRAPLRYPASDVPRIRPRPQTCVQRPRAAEEDLYRPPKYEIAKRDLERRIAAEVGPGGSWRDRPRKTWDVDRPAWDLQAHYIDEIVRFGHERDLPVFAVVIPGYLERGSDPRAVAAFERRFGVPLLTLPMDVRERLYADSGAYFRDRKHLNRRGWTVFTTWLAEAMRVSGA